ncbi:MAG: imidazole glycerol phosphate synthase subunit HisF [Phycisphaerales bacterium]|nr:imidazole glycerol phosphate synthase subunit HisF [Planctomycetota bacterium]MCH8507842.1 imidazole glycerol phosphate synthase subunit HisF [Phycisphaerales bacterium]
MLTVRVIPCLDVRGGRVVKGVKFQGLRDAGDPAELAARYEREGADEIVVLDVSATVEERAAAFDTVGAVRRAVGIPVTVGGGVKTWADAGLLLDAGADRVSVNSAAVAREALVAEIAERFGVQCCVVGIDAAAREGGGWEVVTNSGTKRTGMDVVAWADRCERLGAGEVLLTSWDRDGTKAGYDLELLRAVSGTVSIPVVASGGAAGAHHMAEACEAGAGAVLAASIFHDGVMTVGEVKNELAEAGVPVRLEVSA